MRVTAITPRDDANLPLATHAGTHRLASCTIPAARGMGQFWCPMIARGSGRDRSTTDSPTAGNRPKPSRKRAFPGASELCGTLALLGEDHSAPGHAGIRVGAPTARGSNSPKADSRAATRCAKTRRGPARLNTNAELECHAQWARMPHFKIIAFGAAPYKKLTC